VARVRAQGALRRALARIAGRIVETRAWERLGFARAGDYARERVGLSARTIHDLAHTDAALAKLPRIEAALEAGCIGWTSARLLARVATAPSEAQWLAYAARVTARALEHEVRRVDRGALEGGAICAAEGAGIGEPECDSDGIEIREGVAFRCTPMVRAKWSRVRQLAQRVAGERCAPWQCLEAAMAEVLSTIALDELPESPFAEALPGAACETAGLCEGESALSIFATSPLELPAAGAAGPMGLTSTSATACAGPELDACAEGAARSRPGSGAAPRSPRPRWIRKLVEGIDAVDAFALDARLRRAVESEQRSWAEVAPLLSRLVAGKIHRRLGHRSVEAWTLERLGISPRMLRALLRLERAGAAAPELRAAFHSGRLSWVQAQLLIPLLLLQNARPFRRVWIERAERVSVRRLENDLERALLLRETDPDRFALAGGLPERAGAEPHGALDADEGFIERQTCARESHPDGAMAEPEDARFFLSAPRDVARLFGATLCTVRRLLERQFGRPATPGEAAEAIFDHALATWCALQPYVRREHRVFERDGWRCTVPGCGSYRNLHDHHVELRSLGGSDALSNRTTLCAWHHLRGVHAGRVRCNGTAPNGLRFALGIRPDGSALLRYAPGEVICR
jgi:hypothetical protein